MREVTKLLHAHGGEQWIKPLCEFPNIDSTIEAINTILAPSGLYITIRSIESEAGDKANETKGKQT